MNQPVETPAPETKLRIVAIDNVTKLIHYFSDCSLYTFEKFKQLEEGYREDNYQDADAPVKLPMIPLHCPMRLDAIETRLSLNNIAYYINKRIAQATSEQLREIHDSLTEVAKRL